MALTAARPPRPLLLASSVAAIVSTIPLAYLLVRAGEAGLERVIDVLLRPRTLETTLTSAALVSVVVAASLVVGIPAAYLLARTTLPFPRAWLVALALPLAIPSYVAAYAWLTLVPAFSGFWAAALVLTAVSFPYVMIPTAAALRAADPTFEEVARSLGRGPWRAFAEATLPRAWPAAAAGSLLVALYVLSDFGAVALLRVDTFTRVIYASYRGSFDRTAAAVLALVLVALAVLLVLLERRARGRSQLWRSGSGAARSPIRVQLSAGWTATSTLSLVVLAAVSLVVPIAALVRLLATSRETTVDVASVAQATWGSLTSSVLGAAIAIVLAVPVGMLAARYRSRSTRLIETASYAGHALPGVVVGLSLVFLTVGVPGLYQTLFTLALAYAILFLPKAIGATRSSAVTVAPVLEDVARTLGDRPLVAWMRTTGRLVLPGVVAGGVLVLLTAMKELPATLMLRPTGLETLATQVWAQAQVADYGAAAPYAITLIAVAALPAWLLSRRMR